MRNKSGAFFPDAPLVLFVNPYIHDFAAYDVWARPYGLLSVAGFLRMAGFRVAYLDCLDRFHPAASPADPAARNGRGPYVKTPIEKPPVFADIPRRFSRYGLPPEIIRAELSAMETPDLIFVTSIMTYWYTGAAETISLVKSVFPNTPVVLGGIYPALLPDHAKKTSGADRVAANADLAQSLDLAIRLTRYSPPTEALSGFDPRNPDTWPYPAWDLQRQIPFVPLITSFGCPFRCDYCASPVLAPVRMEKSPRNVMEEIIYWRREFGVTRFVLYDDAFLINAETHAIPLLEAVVRSGLDLRFFTPNALHIRGMGEKTSRLLKAAGFSSVRLGLETTWFSPEKRADRKVTARQFEAALFHLNQAGYAKDQIKAYLLAGLPEQDPEEVAQAIVAAREAGVTPVPAYYSPIPRTPLWEAARAVSRYDLKNEPLCCNNAVFPCMAGGFSWEVITRLKNLAQNTP